jgi:sorting nexin-4
MMDSLSDTLVNVFSRVRKPDERFVEMSDGLERFEDGMGQIDRIVSRNKTRIDGEFTK